MPGVIFHHLSLTVDNTYRFVARDLGSRLGTSFVYGKNEERSPRPNFQWIVGGRNPGWPQPHRDKSH
ncbi:hypothetical protein GQ53DRAFT_750325 [Thozetella sp. PMI_491]|nr:hypothetical protein GQ53DRAFT_750325 [Thozetella sp. PMI_491]